MKKTLYIFIILFAIVFDMALALGSYLYYESLPSGAFVDDNLVAIILCLVQILVYGLIYIRLFRSKNKDSCHIKAKELLFLSLGLAGLTAIWMFFAEKLLINLDIFKNSLDEFTGAFENTGQYSPVLDFLNVAVVGPIMEELFFRGLIYNALKKLRVKPIYAMVLSGLAFGIWHEILVQGVYAALAGFVFAYVYEATGDIKKPMAMHIIGNSLASISILSPELDIIYQLICLAFIPYLFTKMKALGKSILRREDENKL